MSTVRPHSKRDRRRSSRVSISFGGLSEDMIICFFDSYNVLKVWKNSSCVLSLPMMNWISSMRRTSLFLYFSLNSVVVMLFLLRIASISSLVKVSEVTYSILDFALFFNMKWAMACIRWVLPSPTPPYIKRGLYISPGDSATARAAAWARLLFPPTTKVSKVYLGFKLALCMTSGLTDALLFLISWGAAGSSASTICSLTLKSTSHSFSRNSEMVTFNKNPYFLFTYCKKVCSGTMMVTVLSLKECGFKGSSQVL